MSIPDWISQLGTGGVLGVSGLLGGLLAGGAAWRKSKPEARRAGAEAKKAEADAAKALAESAKALGDAATGIAQGVQGQVAALRGEVDQVKAREAERDRRDAEQARLLRVHEDWDHAVVGAVRDLGGDVPDPPPLYPDPNT